MNDTGECVYFVSNACYKTCIKVEDKVYNDHSLFYKNNYRTANIE